VGRRLLQTPSNFGWGFFITFNECFIGRLLQKFTLPPIKIFSCHFNRIKRRIWSEVLVPLPL
ncbi:MAG: hypothetical protein ACPHL7_07450, partial [Flavobacteriaceae bacterium]